MPVSDRLVHDLFTTCVVSDFWGFTVQVWYGMADAPQRNAPHTHTHHRWDGKLFTTSELLWFGEQCRYIYIYMYVCSPGVTLNLLL